VLRVLLDGGSHTRAQICAATGLSRPTVTDTLARFGRGRLITTETRPLGRTGRNPEVILIDPRRAVAFAADVGGTKVIAALVDVAGRTLVERTVRTAADASSLAAQLGDLRRELTAEAGTGLRSVAAAVVGLPGVVGPDGRIAHGGNIPGLDAVDVASMLAAKLRCPVTIENDVNLAGVGELDRSSTGTSGSFVLVSIGTGIGMAVVSDGRIVKGATGRAGEIGYLPLFGDLENAEVREHGSAELATSGTALERRHAERGGSGSAEEILALHDAGDAIARDVVREFADDLARVLVSVAAVLDPSRIVLGGGLGSNPSLLGPVTAAVARIAPFPIAVVVSDLGARSAIRGAAALGARRLCEHLLEEFAGVRTTETSRATGRGAVRATRGR
jgi:predicted NBD/HSP70 family sugar kinase